MPIQPADVPRTQGATADDPAPSEPAHEPADLVPGATEAENLRKQGAALARRFAVVEGKTAAVLRRTAEQTRNPETAERRRRLATEAEQEQARALERAERMDPSGEADESTDHYN